MLKLDNINTIIFDLGGVILNLDTQRTIEAFQKLISKEFIEVYDQVKERELFQNYEKGLISSETFRNGLREYTPKKLSDRDIDAAWNAMLLDIPEKRLKLLKELKNKYRVFLLSNTNEIHLDWFNNYVSDNYGYESLDDFFEVAYYSHHTGMRKPDADIFEMVIEKNNIEPEKAIFIDDFIENIEGAASCKLQTYHMQAEDELCELIKL